MAGGRCPIFKYVDIFSNRQSGEARTLGARGGHAGCGFGCAELVIFRRCGLAASHGSGMYNINNILFGIRMEQNREWDQEDVDFQLNEIVWAKITGFPWWPAKITNKPHPPKHTYRVDFFSQNTHAFLTLTKIAKYDDFRSTFDLNKQGGKGLKKAIAQADKAVELQKAEGSTLVPLFVPIDVINLNQKQLLQQPSPAHHHLQEKKQPPKNQQQQNQSEQSKQQDEESEQSKSELPTLMFSKEQRELFVKTLLKKYKLINLPKLQDIPPRKIFNKPATYPLRRRQVTTKKPSETKIKRTSKFPHQKHTLSYLLSRKIHQLLKQKQGIDNLNRKQISMSLSRQLLNGEGGTQEVNRLFKWVSISSPQIIVGFYQNWGNMQTEKEKSSYMTTQE